MVVALSAVFGPAVASLRERRTAINSRFDAAISALLETQAARHIPSTTPPFIAFKTPADRADYELEMSKRGLQRFLDLTEKTKAALADIAIYVPEARAWITGSWELEEATEPSMRNTIEQRRTAALQSERLFRQRRPLPE
ncbi:hypothetical protein LG314_01155 [Agrococcus terreus]|uniref:hypothetical protein n=1 Tax=Agrococcus terreus TaxID=574649 RepID=UPI00384E5518